LPSRFNTDRALFEAFPSARKDVGVEPQDVDPIDLARELLARGKLNEAVSLCAYLLPRRSAVIWGCRSLRAIHDDIRGYATPSLRAAEEWITRSDDTRQAAARQTGAAADDNEPSTWMARAAGWCGGMLGPSVPIPVPPQLTAIGVRVGLIIALSQKPPAERLARGRATVEDALRMAEQGV
jgi:hypothetical protein